MTDKLLAVVAELREHDHAIVSPEYAREVAKHFGFTAKTEIFEANSIGKGVTLYNDAKSARGVCAADLARQICHHLDVDYDFGGVGSTLRSCCDNLTAHLTKAT